MEDKQNQTFFEIIRNAMKLLDKDLIEKILTISKTISVQKLENGAIRVSVDIMPKNT